MSRDTISFWLFSAISMAHASALEEDRRSIFTGQSSRNKKDCDFFDV